MKEFYTYAHIRKDTGKIFYIGKGKNNRLFDIDRNIHWKNIANKHGFHAEILAYWKTEQEAFEHEKILISCFKDMKYSLANVTEGGEGPAGFKFSIESRKKVSEVTKGENNPFYGRKYSEQSIKIISEKASIRFKGNTYAKNNTKPKTKEHALKISEALKGVKFSDEHRANLIKAWEKRRK